MNNLKICRLSAVLLVLLFSTGIVAAQNNYKESFQVGDDVLVSVNTSHTNIVFETWDRDVVEVEAYVEGDDLTAKEKQEIFENWDFDVLGNSKKVVIRSNSGGLWGGHQNMVPLEALKSLESLKALENLPELNSIKNLNFDDFDFHFEVPDIPDFEEFPNWPFSDDQVNVVDSKGNHNYNFHNNKNRTFNVREYRKNKKAYVDKLNKKHGTKVTVKEVDNWLEEVDEWTEGFSDVMEEWGENFSFEFEHKFGPEFELKMEKWGEEFGKDMEKWSEKLEMDMEKWGEKFGKDMERWAEEFEKNAEHWNHNFDKNGNIFFFEGGDKGLFNGKKAKKTIIIRMPKGSKTDINVRYGEIKMADAYNVKATLNYSSLSANSIDGGESLINAAYAPVYVNNWVNGDLYLKYVDDCRINNVRKINVDANSSNVNINALVGSAILTGSHGTFLINDLSDNFKAITINLDNTDATMNIPKTAFSFSFDGKKSTLLVPKELLQDKTKRDGRILISGFHKKKNNNRVVTINAKYSNVKMQ